MRTGPKPKGASRKEAHALLPCFAGKEITLLMQTLNTLSTLRVKLAALCKKYAELVSASFTTLLPWEGGTFLTTPSCIIFLPMGLNKLIGGELS